MSEKRFSPFKKDKKTLDMGIPLCYINKAAP